MVPSNPGKQIWTETVGSFFVNINAVNDFGQTGKYVPETFQQHSIIQSRQLRWISWVSSEGCRTLRPTKQESLDIVHSLKRGQSGHNEWTRQEDNGSRRGF